MKNRRYEIGDRVRALVDCPEKFTKVKKGDTGTIMDAIDTVPYIEWDNNGLWAMKQDEVELIKEDTQ